MLSATVVVAFDRENMTPLIVEGVRNKNVGEPVKANDPVRIASISKLIMALATLRLVDEGKVELDTDVSDYLGWQVRSPGFPDSPVTLRQLLSHRSGLRDAMGYVVPLSESLQEKLAEPKAWYADARPGEAPFEYANLGSLVAATALEAGCDIVLNCWAKMEDQLGIAERCPPVSGLTAERLARVHDAIRKPPNSSAERTERKAALLAKRDALLAVATASA